MKNKMSNEQLVSHLQSILSKRPVAVKKVCKNCGVEYSVDTSDDESELCLACQVRKDMKLSEDTIINRNILNLWKAKRYDKDSGIDPLLCAVAEGVMLLPDECENRNHLSVITAKKVKISDEKMVGYIPKIVRNSNKKYDAIVFIRFNPNEDFSIFAIRFSDRLVRILSKCDTIKIKTFCFSLIVKHVERQVVKASKNPKK